MSIYNTKCSFSKTLPDAIMIELVNLSIHNNKRSFSKADAMIIELFQWLKPDDNHNLTTINQEFCCFRGKGYFRQYINQKTSIKMFTNAALLKKVLSRVQSWKCSHFIDVSSLGNVHTLKLSHCTNISDVSGLGNVKKIRFVWK